MWRSSYIYYKLYTKQIWDFRQLNGINITGSKLVYIILKCNLIVNFAY